MVCLGFEPVRSMAGAGETIELWRPPYGSKGYGRSLIIHKLRIQIPTKDTLFKVQFVQFEKNKNKFKRGHRWPIFKKRWIQKDFCWSKSTFFQANNYVMILKCHFLFPLIKMFKINLSLSLSWVIQSVFLFKMFARPLTSMFKST